MPGSRACVGVRAPLGQAGRAGLAGAFWCASPFPLAGLGALFVCSAPSGLGLPGLWLLLLFFPFLPPRCLWRSVFSGPGCLGPWHLVVPPLFFFFSQRPPPASFCSFLLFFRFLFVWGIFFASFLFFSPALVCRLCVAGPVCVSWGVGCVGVCCCGRCAPAGAGFRLRCVVRCSMPVPALCVLLLVSVGAVLAAFLFPVLPLVTCLCGLSCGCVLRRPLQPVVALGCCGGAALLRRVLSCFFALRWCVLCWSLFWCGVLPRSGVPCGVVRPPPRGCCARFFFCRVYTGCAAPPPPPPAGCGALCHAVSCVGSCGAAVCGVFWVLPGAVWRSCVGLGSCAVLFGAVLCWVLLCCFCCALLLYAAALSAGFFFAFFLAFPWCSVLFLSLWCCAVVRLAVRRGPVALHSCAGFRCAVLFCALLCRGASLGSVLCCLFRCGASVAFCLVPYCGGLLRSVCPWARCCVVLRCCCSLCCVSGRLPFRGAPCAVLWWCACVVAPYAVLSCPCGAGWCFVLWPVVFGCLLLGLAVLCSLLVGPGGSGCRVSVVRCGVSLGAALRRAAARCAARRCVVVRSVVLFCFALFGAVARFVVPWGAVLCPGVPCLPALCFVLSPRAVCVLPGCFAACCCSPLCFVLSASWGVVLCVPCPLRPVRCCCAALLTLGALLPCAVPLSAVLPCGAVVSCPAALFGLLPGFVWFLLLTAAKFVKIFLRLLQMK